ncbi:ATP-binding protein [Prosthecobacter sp.]|uniref:AAA family ATPase n=1 Tax=Prosthecobacter sp. TaxID=1965333 RepID=UPI002AB9EEBF|nr:ATP-binding protein [Prosthecobacter sp.]MDZ4401448.1 ATP-binding protein [Prosthecobacter sp.]
MPSAAQVKALLQSHTSGDDERFYAVALQVAAAEARHGHETLAKDLRTLVDRAKSKRSLAHATTNVLHIAQPTGEAAELLDSQHPEISVRDLVLSDAIRERVQRVIQEQRQINRLQAHGLRPRQRLLFTGPPGCGKTMTASAIASELRLPLFVVRLDALITRYLGESANKLRLIFDAVNQTRAVYLFDEFDSIGYSRESGNDVGEMRRVLNSFLVFIERMHSHSLVIAATNHGGRLDKALYRRFDDLIEFSLPGELQIRQMIDSRLQSIAAPKLMWPRIVKAAANLSFGEIGRACEDAMKQSILKETGKVTTTSLIAALKERRLFLPPLSEP